jgi:hypothetical protein
VLTTTLKEVQDNIKVVLDLNYTLPENWMGNFTSYMPNLAGATSFLLIQYKINMS